MNRRAIQLLAVCSLAAHCGQAAAAPGRGASTLVHASVHGAPPPAATLPSPPPTAATAPASDGGQATPDAASQQPGGPLAHAIAIEDASGHALAAFYAALRAVHTEHRQARLMFYGASHVAADFYTDVIRSKLQQRFGDAGTGFVVPAHPFGGYRNAGIELKPSTGFRGVDVKAKAPVEDRYGIAGVYLRARKKAASAVFATRAHAGVSGAASRFELYYLKQPGGGRLRVSVDGQLRRELSTNSRAASPAYAVFDAADGQHELEIGTTGDGPVQIFGVAVERNTPGVVLDTLGIPGSRIAYHLLWDDAIYREHLAHRHPDLVVLAYGTNESGDDEPIEQYTADMRKVVERVRQVAPQASCLLIGPSDRPVLHDDGSYSGRPRTAEIIEAQRAVATQYGCGFFDLVAFMGGPASMLRWVAAEPPMATSDHVHFTRRGYEELGRILYDALMAGYSDTGSVTPTPPSSNEAPLSVASPDTRQSL